jgi:hypothetical protein
VRPTGIDAPRGGNLVSALKCKNGRPVGVAFRPPRDSALVGAVPRLPRRRRTHLRCALRADVGTPSREAPQASLPPSRSDRVPVPDRAVPRRSVDRARLCHAGRGAESARRVLLRPRRERRGALKGTKRRQHRTAYSSPSQSRVGRCGVAKIKTNPGDPGDKEENENCPFPKRCDEVIFQQQGDAPRRR